MKMSLAQALRKKAELINELSTLQSRLVEGVVYKEHDELYSKDDMKEMQNMMNLKRVELLSLKLAIDNGNHTVMSGKTVYALIVEKGEVKAELEFWCQTRNTVAQSMTHRFGYDEKAPKVLTRITVKQADTNIDSLRKMLKTLDNNISDLNGKIEVEF
jgi:hypothetical protein